MLEQLQLQLGQYQDKLKHLVWLIWANRGMIVVGYLVSAMFNVLHAEWNVFSVVIAIVSPSLLLFAFEVGSRIPIPKQPGILRWVGIAVRIIATVAIAGITAWISYFHQRDSFMRWGGDETQAAVLPIAIDLFMIVGSVGVMEVTSLIKDVKSDIREVELRIAGLLGAKRSKEILADEPVVAKPPTGREKIAMAMAEMPWATVKEIAARAGTKEAYTGTVVSELRKAQRTNGNGTPAVLVTN